jgi:hypothetical protein
MSIRCKQAFAKDFTVKMDWGTMAFQDGLSLPSGYPRSRQRSGMLGLGLRTSILDLGLPLWSLKGGV